MKDRIADFVHGSDGLGNTYPTLSDRKPIDTFAPDFLIQKVNEFPGEIIIVALGPLTNLAKVGSFRVLICFLVCILALLMNLRILCAELRTAFQLNLRMKLIHIPLSGFQTTCPSSDGC